MKNIKVLKSFITLAVASSMICGCLMLAGCDDKNDTNATTTAASVVEATTTSATEEETITVDVTPATTEETEFTYETAAITEFEDSYVQALAQKYLDRNMFLVPGEGDELTSFGEGVVEAFLAQTNQPEDGSASTVMEMSIVLRFDTAEHALASFEDLSEAISTDENVVFVDNEVVTYYELSDSSSTLYAEMDKEHNVVVYYLYYDISGASTEQVDTDDGADLADDEVVETAVETEAEEA